MKHQPFQNFINTSPQRYIIPQGNRKVPEIEYRYTSDIGDILSSLDIETEINTLKSELFKIDRSEHFLYIKLTLDDLINAYFDIRLGMSNIIKDRELQRCLMFEVYNAILAIITLLHKMNIVIPQGFIADYERRDKTGIITGVLKTFPNQSQNDTLTIINQSKPEQKEILSQFTLIQKEAIFSKLKETDCFIESETGYKWNGSKSLLAYFVDVASDKLGLRPSSDKIPWKPFEELFNMSGLSSTRNEYANKTGSLPDGYKNIDNIFKE